MDLTNFKVIDKTMKATTILSLLFGGIMAIAFICCFIYLSNKIDKAYSHALVIDTSGKVYETTTVESAQMRKYEYENHIKMFVNTWYAFDESNYEKNIQTALHWIGNRGKELLSEYRDVDMYNSLIQKNIRYGVLLKDIELDITTLPVSGKIYFTQMGFRSRGSSARDVFVDFTLYDVDRSSENPHGVKIEDWIVRYSEPRATTNEEERTNKSYQDE